MSEPGTERRVEEARDVSGSTFIAVACGLLAEARIAARLGGVRAIAGGGDAGRVAAELERALGDGAEGVLSFGIAGGLKPELPTGTVVVAGAVRHGAERYAADAAWSDGLRRALPGAIEADVVGVDAPVTSAIDKLELHQATGAVACDMESHVAARVAAKAGVPFAVLRVVADPGSRALPSAALVGMKKDGATDAGAVLAKLVTRPWQLPALIRVGADSRTAMGVLLGCCRRLGPAAGLGGA